MSALQAGVITVNWRGQNESTILFVHGICRGFRRQGLESRGRLELDHVRRFAFIVTTTTDLSLHST